MWLGVRNAFRSLIRRRRLTTLAVIATVGPVLGGVTIIFSLVNAVLLRPLPYADVGRLVRIRLQDRAVGLRESMPFPLFERIASGARSVESAAAFRIEPLNIKGDRWHIVQAAVTTGNIFDVLGARPVLGRHFLRDDDRAKGEEPVVLSEALWRRAFGSDASIIGRRMRLSRLIATGTTWCVVVGITPAVLAAGPGEFVDLYLPERVDAENRMSWVAGDHRVLVRARAGITQDALRREVEAVARQAGPLLSGAEIDSAVVDPLANELGIKWEERLWSLFVLAVLALLIACVNIASLLHAGNRARSHELTTRLALGATPRQLAGQLLIESLLTACAGGAVSLLVASAGLPLFVALAPADIPRLAAVSLDKTTIGFAVATALVAGMLFGLAPAAALLRQGWSDLAGGGRRGPRTTLRWGAEALVIVQLALATAFTAGSLLALGSEWRLLRAPVGFDTERVLTARLDTGARYADASTEEWFQARLLALGARLRHISALAVTNQLPPNVNSTYTLWLPDGHKVGQLALDVSPGYFDVLRIPVTAGAVPRWGERVGGKAVVNEAFAVRWFNRKDAVGETVRFGFDQLQIVAVTRNTREAAVRLPAKPVLYVLWGPGAHRPRVRWFVLARARDRSAMAMTELEDALREVDPDLPVTLDWLDTRFANDRAETTFYARILLFLAAVTVLIAGVGVAAIAREAVARRTAEAAIRLALGATLPSVRRRLVLPAWVAGGVGVLAGTWLASVTGFLLATALYDVSPRDWVTLASAGLLLMAIATAAAYVPARAVSDKDVVTLLRTE